MNNSTNELIKLLEKYKETNKDVELESVLKFKKVPIQKKDLSIKKQENNEKKEKISDLEGVEEVLSKESRFSYEFNRNVLNNPVNNILIDCDASNNHDLIRAIIKNSIDNKKTPILVLTSTNYKTMLDFLKKSKVNLDKVFIIDTVSKNLISVENSSNILFVDSLRNLTQLQILIIKLLNEKNNCVLIFDSVDILEFYHSEKVILKFVYSLSKLIQKRNAWFNCIVNSDILGPKLSQFFNDFVQLKKVE